MAKIVIIEDDVFLLKVYNLKLKKKGFDTVIVDTGSKALSTVKREDPDLVLLDVIMPEKDGFDILQELRADPKTKKIKVAMLTALGTDEDKKKAFKFGADSYLVKSDYSFEELVENIKQILLNK